jgi:hypothetical protein
MLGIMMVLGMLISSFGVFGYRLQRQSSTLRRCADDIRLAVTAGEKWRADVRSATVPPRLNDGVLYVPQGRAELAYRFRDGGVERRGRNGGWRPFLRGVKASRMVRERRRHVTVWRWELELQARADGARLRPLFSFLAVAKGGRR